MITFPLCPTVEVGEALKSSQLAGLADSINARLRSGLGDGAWRLAYYFLQQFRQIRNPDDSGYLWPSNAEFLEYYQHTAPSSDWAWPIAGPDEAEGANTESIMPAFVFGSAQDSIDSESDRIGGNSDMPTSVGTGTVLELWRLGQAQRGAYDPASGDYASPAFDAARWHYQVVRSALGPHGNSYGGFAPTPDGSAGCGDATSYSPERRNYQIFFTSIKDNVTIYPAPWTSGCPGAALGIVGIGRFPWAYWVFYNNGANNAVLLDIIPTNLWLEGPYSGGNRLQRQPSGFIPRVLNAFASDFRGTQAQLDAPNRWNSNAFDTNRFFSTQYHLAPARGVTNGTNIEAVYPAFWLYGSQRISKGVALKKTVGGVLHQVGSGSVIASAFVLGQRLFQPTSIEILVDLVVVKTVTLTPDENGTSQQIITFDPPIESPQNVRVRLGSDLALSDTSDSAGVLIEFAEVLSYKPEAHDLYLVLRLSGALIETVQGSDGSGLNEEQSKELGESYFGNACIAPIHGALSVASSVAEINTNAVFDAARRMSRTTRMLRRQQLTGYAVQGGKSILWFVRSPYGVGGNHPTWVPTDPPASGLTASGDLVAGQMYIVKGASLGVDYIEYPVASGTLYEGTDTFECADGSITFTAYGTAEVYLVQRILANSYSTGSSTGDAFEGIGPSLSAIASDALEVGRQYVVVGPSTGQVWYEGHGYTDGQIVTATATGGEYQSLAEAVLYEYDGIKSIAPRNGFTNEWLFDISLKHTHPSISSIWKAEAFTDYAAIYDRCQFMARPSHISSNSEARWHFHYGSKIWMIPEAVPGYRYMSTSGVQLNDENCAADPTCEAAMVQFYKSCRIYEPPCEIESAVMVMVDDQPRLKITLTGRLHSHESAVASFTEDVTTWDLVALAAEDYRTLDNGIREYIVSQTTGYGTGCGGGEDPTVGYARVGNSAWDSPVWGNPDNPFGACNPEFVFTKLIPEPYDDGNDKQNSVDTPFWHDQMRMAELYLRVISEGFVDGTTSEAYGCTSGFAVYDYTFENLCFDAFGGRWFNTIPTQETGTFTESLTRPDKPMGFGPLPNTIASAEIFNQFAAVVNKLDKVRVPMPWIFEARNIEGTNEDIPVSAYEPDGTDTACSGLPPAGVIWTGTPPGSGATTAGAWATQVSPISIGASLSSGFQTYSSGGIPDTQLLCDGVAWTIGTSRTDVQYRISLATADALNAIPPGWADMIETHGTALGSQYTSIGVNVPVVTTDPLLSACADDSGIWDYHSGGNYLTWNETNTATPTTCSIVRAGTLTAPGFSPTMFLAGYDNVGTLGVCTFGSGTGATIEVIDTPDFMLTVPLV